MKIHRRVSRILLAGFTAGVLATGFSSAQERPSILVGHGSLSGSILPLWVGAEAKLFDKHGLQVKPIYLPRAAGRSALLAGDIQIYFSVAPPLVQMRLAGGDIAITSCVVHKLVSKVMVAPSIQKVADLRGKVFGVANPGSGSDFTAKLFISRQGWKLGQDASVIYTGSTSANFAALANGRVHAIFANAPDDRQALLAGFKPLVELGDLNIPYSGNCTSAMRPYLAKQPARMRSFLAGVVEAIAYIKVRPNEAKAVLRKYTRVSDPAVLQHSYESDTRFMEVVPYPNTDGIKLILEQLGVTGQAAETFVKEFIDDRPMKQLVDEGLLKQLYSSGAPAR